MAWNDAAETIVAGTGQVYVAPVGTTLPTTAEAAVDSSFVGLGFHTEDGVSMNKTLEIVEFRAWQSRHPIRRERETEDFQLTFVLQQWNEQTLPFALGGGTVTQVTAGHYKYTPPGDDDQLDERSLICDVIDGDRIARFVIPRGTVSEGVESTFQRSEMAGLPVTFKALEPATGGDPWHVLFNDDDAFATGS